VQKHIRIIITNTQVLAVSNLFHFHLKLFLKNDDKSENKFTMLPAKACMSK